MTYSIILPVQELTNYDILQLTMNSLTHDASSQGLLNSEQMN